MSIHTRAGAARLQSLSLLRRTPVALAIGLALCAPQFALAQEEAEAEELEEVTITGTRIRVVTGMDTPTPVAALSADELLAISPTSVTAALVSLPQFAASATAENFGVSLNNNFFSSPGGGSLNLRGIGSKRTLTLLDSRRVVPGTAFGGPDINMFPDQMLRRVETVTGGASAAYGTDAVSGVVNYVLDTAFEGLRMSAQGGFSDRKDAENQRYSMALGHKLGERAHLLLSAGYSRQDELRGYGSRDWYKGCGLMQNSGVPSNVATLTGAVVPPGAYNATTWVAGRGGYSQDTPMYVPVCNLHNTGGTYDGMFTIAGQTYELQPDGSAIPYVNTRSGAAATSGVQVGGGGQNINEERGLLMPSSRRKNVFTYLDYDVTDNFNVYAQGMIGWQTLRNHGGVGDFLNGPPQALTIFRDNAFLPDSVAAIMDAANVTSFAMTRYGHQDDWGVGSFANTSRTRGATLGFKSTLTADGFFNGWTLDGYIQYGDSNLDAAQEDGMRLDRVYHAVDAVVDDDTGSIRCRVTEQSGYLPDCVPLNVFGRGNASPAAVDWVRGYDPDISVTVNPFTGFDLNGDPTYGAPYSYIGDEDKHRIVRLTQKVFEVTASGRLFDGWAGPVSAALGVHWREESVDQKVHASQGNSAADATYRPVWCNDGNADARCVEQINRGIRPAGDIGVRGVPANPWQNIVEMQFSNVPFIAGTYNVKEVFAETMVPLFSGAPWMRELNFLGSGRWADYAGSGSIWSYKAGLNATFTDELRLRGTYSRDTRAANIAERFDRTGGFTLGLTDFVTPVPPGWQQGVSAATTVNGGNPEVDPEEADTFTVGLVYRPRWLAGFNMSVDWLSVSLKGAIETLPAQTVLNLCRDGDQDQCARISRDPTTNAILFVPQTYQNLSKSDFEAVDVELGYSHRVKLLGGNERVGVRMFGTYLIESSTTNSAGLKTDWTGSVPLQYFQKRVNLTLDYTNGPFQWNLTGRYNGGGKLDTSYNQVRSIGSVDTAPDPDVYVEAATARIWQVADNTIGGSVYWDTRLGYDIPVTRGTLELFVNVNNLFDRDPPIVPGLNLTNQFNSAYDIIGRRYVMGVNLRF